MFEHYTPQGLAGLLRRQGPMSQSSLRSYGFTQSEIDAAYRQGLIKRGAHKMAGASLRYFYV